MIHLWVDANAARSVKDLRDLCRRAKRKSVQVVVHAQVYLERRRQMRAQQRERFSESLFDDFLAQVGIVVSPALLDQRAAAEFADLLHERYRSDDAWEAAKKNTLGGVLRAGFAVEPGQIPMTTDWLIALEVERDPEARVITHDGGEEWRFLRTSTPKRALDWDEAITWLDGLPG